MNFLAHAYLSDDDVDVMVGNLIGDYVKGKKVLETYPESIRKGIMLHRHIDSYTDQHPATLRAKNYFRPAYRLYSGALVDAINDHFLANDPRYFPSEGVLFQFTQNVFNALRKRSEFIPEKFAPVLKYMEQENWLYACRTLKGMNQVFNRLQHHAKYLEPSNAAYEILVTNYYALNQCYYELIDDLVKFSKNTTA